MSKDLPYLKFNAAEYLNGEITLEDFYTQGVFINLCAYYWFKSGSLSLTEIKRRVKCKQAALDRLIESNIIKVVGDNITISFLDEQLAERGHKSKINSLNGSLGGAPIGNKNALKNNRLTTDLQPKTSNIEKRREEEREKESYTHPKEAFEDITNNYLETEPQRKIINNKGWTSATERDVNALLYHYLELQADLTMRTKHDIKKHFRSWLNKYDVVELQKISKQINERLQTKVS